MKITIEVKPFKNGEPMVQTTCEYMLPNDTLWELIKEDVKKINDKLNDALVTKVFGQKG